MKPKSTNAKFIQNLQEKFPEVILAFFAKNVLYLIPKSIVSQTQQDEIRHYVSTELQDATLTTTFLQSNKSVKLNAGLVLKVVKERMPASVELITSELNTKKIEFSPDDLNTFLTRLIESAHIIEPETNRYLVTIKGLRALPRQRNKSNSDITRALVLARRSW